MLFCRHETIFLCIYMKKGRENAPRKGKLAKMTKNSRFLLVCVLAYALLLAGCTAPAPPYFSYRGETFRAELRGTVRQMPFCAVVVAEPTATGYAVQIQYLGDPTCRTAYPLEGLMLAAAVTAEGVPCGEATLTYQTLSTHASAALAKGWLLPLTVLLAPTGVASVQKEEGGFCLGLESGGTLRLGGEMLPAAYTSQSISFSVVWWEREP